MSLNNLTTADLQNLLMEETKKFTAGLREGCSLEERDVMRKKIEDILKVLEQRKQKKNGSHESVM